MRRFFVAALVVFGLTVAASFGQERSKEPLVDDAAVRSVSAAYVEAFNKRDSAALAELWSAEAVYVDRNSGEEFVGRAAIAEHFKALFAASPELKLAVDVESVRFLSPNVAVEQGTARVLEKDAEPDVVAYTAIYLKRDGKWLLDRETDEETDASPTSNYEQLKVLEWLVGHWVDQDDEVRVETDCRWSKNENFLIRSFSVQTERKVESSGMQVIGWDEADKKIRSWAFDSDGGVAEAVWTKRGEQWFVVNKGVLADGRRASMVNVLRPIDADSFTWQTIERSVGDELLPNTGAVLIVRE